MNNIDRLIATLYPNGVEYSPLEKLCISLKKSTLTQDKLNDSLQYPVINSGRDYYGRFSEYNNEGNAIVIASRGEYAGFVSYISEKFWAGGLCYPYRSRSETKAHTKYIFYVLKNSEQRIMDSLVARGSIPALNKADIDKFLIPLPPLPVQEEIVRILDTFSGMVAELEAEQAARVRQYEHYRNELLINHGMFTIATDRDEMREYSLNEVCLPVSNIRWNENGGKTFRYIDLTSTEIATKSIQDTLTITSEDAPSRAQQIVRVNDVIFGSTRPTLKRFAFITNEFDGEICSTGFCVLRSDPKKILPKYLYFHISSTAFEDHVEKYQRGSAYPAISDKDLKSFKIPVPPLDVQEQIVSILDRFDALVNDLKSGLPAEIALRRKQYEYYRDKLLTFEPKQPPL